MAKSSTNISPRKPSFIFGYWRPWKEESDFFDSYFNYVKDVSLAKYNADTIGSYIESASEKQIQAIDELGRKVGIGFNALNNQMSLVQKQLRFLNKNTEIQIEQQRLSNFLLHNIVELLKIPDSEKERQRCIELGIKFMVEAKKDPDLFEDALSELLKAEQFMKQDYFVLHRIGMIYLFSFKHINPHKAFDYFIRAAKYAAVESDKNVLRISRALQAPDHQATGSTEEVSSLLYESFEKAAFCAYVLGDFKTAVEYQLKSQKELITPEKLFTLAKYQSRNNNIDDCLDNLIKAIRSKPILLLAVFKDFDLINESKVLELIGEINDSIDNKINSLIEVFKGTESSQSMTFAIDLVEAKSLRYDLKVQLYNKLIKESKKYEVYINRELSNIDKLIEDFKMCNYYNISRKEISAFIVELEEAKGKPIELMKSTYARLFEINSINKIKIGIKYAGGIVFHLYNNGKNGLVFSDTDLGTAAWGASGVTGTEEGFGTGANNTKLIVEGAGYRIKSGLIFDTKLPIVTAAQICINLNHNGHNDWYLPSKVELDLLLENYEEIKTYIKYDGYWSSSSVECPPDTKPRDFSFSEYQAKERLYKELGMSFKQAEEYELTQFNDNCKGINAFAAIISSPYGCISNNKDEILNVIAIRSF